jgi:aminomethyltransferase
MSVIARFGEVAREFQACMGGCAVLDQAWRVRIRVSGSDAKRWLNGMVTNTAALEDGDGNYSFLLNAQGRLQGDAYVFRQGEDYLLETSADQKDKLLAWLDHYIIMDDVTLVPDSSMAATIAVAGPDCEAVLAHLGTDVAGLGALHLQAASAAGVPCRIVRDDTRCVPLFGIWHDPAASEQLWAALVQAGATPAGSDAAELLRIASGTPLFGKDLQERDLPQETGQSRALHFSKGCYIGQEIVERIHSRGNVHRGWRGLTADRPLPEGVEIMVEEKAIGRLTSVATLPFLSRTVHVGLGIVRTQPIDEHKALTAQGTTVHPSPLPFTKNLE